MVTQATALSRTGVSDWIIQRVSAVILSLSPLCVVAFVLPTRGLGYVAWVDFFPPPAMKIFTLLALTSLCAHAWIGMWAIGGDYLREHLMGPKATTLRFAYQIGCVLITIAYFLWGINILWGN